MNTNTAQYTRGPWTRARMLLPPRAKDRRCGFVVNGPEAAEQSLPTRICDLRVPIGINGFSEGEANACLIAAAPEMLEALRLLVLEFKDVTPRSPAVDMARRCALDTARAAIARAEGRTP